MMNEDVDCRCRRARGGRTGEAAPVCEGSEGDVRERVRGRRPPEDPRARDTAHVDEGSALKVDEGAHVYQGVQQVAASSSDAGPR